MQQKYPYFNSLLLLFRYITTTTITMISITIFFILSTVLPSATVKYNYYFNVVLYITTIKIHYYYYCSCADSLDSSRMKRPYTLLQELKKTAPLIQPRQKRVMLEYNLLFIIILFFSFQRTLLSAYLQSLANCCHFAADATSSKHFIPLPSAGSSLCFFLFSSSSIRSCERIWQHYNQWCQRSKRYLVK